jgi:hypothetical protein
MSYTPNSNSSNNLNSGYVGLTTFVAILITVGICWSCFGCIFTLACFQRRQSLEGRPVNGHLRNRNGRGQKEENDGRGVQPDIEQVLLGCNEGEELGGRQDAQLQPLSVHQQTSDLLVDISFFIQMPRPNSPVLAKCPQTPPDLLRDELLIATTSSRLTTIRR